MRARSEGSKARADPACIAQRTLCLLCAAAAAAAAAIGGGRRKDARGISSQRKTLLGRRFSANETGSRCTMKSWSKGVPMTEGLERPLHMQDSRRDDEHD